MSAQYQHLLEVSQLDGQASQRSRQKGRLGKDGYTKTDEFLEKFQTGGGGHFQSKNLYCRFWTFKQGFLSMKLIQKGHFRVCFSTIVLRKIKTRHILELFQKFIGFGDVILP